MIVKLLTLLVLTSPYGIVCARLKLLHSSNVHRFSESEINSTSLNDWNSRIFGLSTSRINGTNSINFNRPKVLVVISVSGVESFEQFRDEQTDLPFDGDFDTEQLQRNFKKTFGNTMQMAEVSYKGISGSEIAQQAKRITLGKTIGIEDEKLRSGIINMQKIVKAIGGKKFDKNNVVDFYRFEIDISEQYVNVTQLKTEIKLTIQDFHQVIKRAYGDDGVVMEIYTHPVLTSKFLSDIVKKARKTYNVVEPANIDTPATVGIVVLVAVIFSYALLAAVFHMFDSDMSKNSLLYRLSNGKSKKNM